MKAPRFSHLRSVVNLQSGSFHSAMNQDVLFLHHSNIIGFFSAFPQDMPASCASDMTQMPKRISKHPAGLLKLVQI